MRTVEGAVVPERSSLQRPRYLHEIRSGREVTHSPKGADNVCVGVWERGGSSVTSVFVYVQAGGVESRGLCGHRAWRGRDVRQQGALGASQGEP